MPPLPRKGAIKVTHFINPHMFWYKYESSFIKNAELLTLEENLQQYVRSLKGLEHGYVPKIDEVVVVMHLTWKKWIRVVVDTMIEYSDGNTYILWSIDHGVPLESKIRWIRPLSKDLINVKFESVFFGGINNIVPATKVIDFENDLKLRLKCIQAWPEGICSSIEKLINDSALITFTPEITVHNNHYFGELEIQTYAGKKYVVNKFLIELEQGLAIINFEKEILKLNTIDIVRYKNNQNNVVALSNANKIQSVFSGGRNQVVTDVMTDNEYDIEVNGKIDDWNKRNNLDNLSKYDDIMDSVSVIADAANGALKPSTEVPQTTKRVSRLEPKFTTEPMDYTFTQLCGAAHKRRSQTYANKSIRYPNEKSLTMSASSEIMPDEVVKNNLVSSEIITRPKSRLDIAREMQRKLELQKSKNNESVVSESVKSSTMSVADRFTNLSIASSVIENTAKTPSPTESVVSTVSRKLSILRACSEKMAQMDDQKLKEYQQYTLNGTTESSLEKRKELLEKLKQVSMTVPKYNHPESKKSDEKPAIQPKFSKKPIEKVPFEPVERADIEKPKESKRKADTTELVMIPAGFALNDLESIGHKSNSKKSNKLNSSKSSEEFRNNSSFSDNATKLQYNRDNKKTSSFKKALAEEQCHLKWNSSLFLHRVLVHGKHKPKPIEKQSYANFTDAVHNELELMRFNQIYRIQTYAWPHIMQGNSFMVVNRADTGKTLSYVPAICSQVQIASVEEEIPKGVGPIAIIMCESAIAVEAVVRLCKRLSNNAPKKLSIVSAYGVRDLPKLNTLLLNGCDILVTTAPCLTRLMTSTFRLFSRERVQHFVIDNIDMIYDNFASDIQGAVKRFCIPKAKEEPIQIVVTSRSWHPILEQFFKIEKNPVLCIADYIEAAVYAKSLLSLKLMEHKYKLNEVVQYLKSHTYLEERTIIICKGIVDVMEVVERLQLESIFYMFCHENSDAEEISRAKIFDLQHVKGTFQVLVCTDEVLSELNIKSAQHLIHYSLPDKWRLFSYRYSVCFDYYDDLLCSPTPQKPQATSKVYLDENNNEELPRLIQFLQYHGCCTFSDDILKLSKTIQMQIEEKQTSDLKPFCKYILLLGKCTNRMSCRTSRHVLTKTDAPKEHMPRNGRIKIQPLHVHSPTHISARLLDFKSADDKSWHKANRSDEYLRFNLDFSIYYYNEENHISQWPIKLGELCVIITADMTPHRCQIAEEIDNNGKKVVADVSLRVRLIDIGTTMLCRGSELLKLVADFKDFPVQAVDIRMCGIVPHDFECDWDSKVTAHVQKWMDDNLRENVHVECNVLLTMMDTIWVDTFRLVEKLSTVATSVNILSIKKNLLDKDFGVADDTALASLMNIVKEFESFNNTQEEVTPMVKTPHRGRRGPQKTCNSLSSTDEPEVRRRLSSVVAKQPLKDYGCSGSSEDVIVSSSTSTSMSNSLKMISSQEEPLLLPSSNNYGKSSSSDDGDFIKIDKKPNEKWAELKDQATCYEVYVSTFDTPETCYLLNLAERNLRQKLYEAIDEYTANLDNLENLIDCVEDGRNCLAPLHGKYNRGKIMDYYSDMDTNEIKTKIFFVDLGETAEIPLKNLIDMPYDLIELAPFQAILVKFIGIKPKNNEDHWSIDTCDKIFDQMLDIDNSKTYVRVIFETTSFSEHSILKFHSYNVVMLDGTDETNPIRLNDLCVQKNLADYDLNTKHYLDILCTIKPPLPASHTSVDYEKLSYDSDDGSENWDDCNYINERFVERDAQKPLLQERTMTKHDEGFSVEFTEADILALLHYPPTAKILPADQSGQKPLAQLKSIEENPPHLNKTKKNKCTKSKLTLDDSSISSDDEKDSYTFNGIALPILLYPAKIPKVKWQQSSSLIVLHILAPDIKDYGLRVLVRNVQISCTVANVENLCFLNLFGCIDPKYTSHEIRGLYIVVRLLKLYKGIIWPRLLSNNDKYHWLTYNNDALQLSDERLVNIGNEQEYSRFIESSDSYDEDSDDDIYINKANFQDIDKYDPTNEDF